jgi:DnaJ-class molecular chaperone
MGKGQAIKSGRACTLCSGKKTCFVKRKFDLKIPKGVPNEYEIKMPNKGAYDVDSKQHGDIVFRIMYKIEKPYSIRPNGDVVYRLDISIDELLSGFKKVVTIYKDKFMLVSNHYFNPNKKTIIKGKGLKSNSNLYIEFNVVYTDSVRCEKYQEAFAKIFGVTKSQDEEETSMTIGVQTNLVSGFV